MRNYTEQTTEIGELPNGIHAPADAEYVMWGRITREDDDEGPYVDITGTVDDVVKSQSSKLKA